MRVVLTLVILWVTVSLPLGLFAGRLLSRTVNEPSIADEIEAYLRHLGPRSRTWRPSATIGVLALALATVLLGTPTGRRLPDQALVTLSRWSQAAFPDPAPSVAEALPQAPAAGAPPQTGARPRPHPPPAVVPPDVPAAAVAAPGPGAGAGRAYDAVSAALVAGVGVHRASHGAARRGTRRPRCEVRAAEPSKSPAQAVRGARRRRTSPRPRPPASSRLRPPLRPLRAVADGSRRPAAAGELPRRPPPPGPPTPRPHAAPPAPARPPASDRRARRATPAARHPGGPPAAPATPATRRGRTPAAGRHRPRPLSPQPDGGARRRTRRDRPDRSRTEAGARSGRAAGPMQVAPYVRRARRPAEPTPVARRPGDPRGRSTGPRATTDPADRAGRSPSAEDGDVEQTAPSCRRPPPGRRHGHGRGDAQAAGTTADDDARRPRTRSTLSRTSSTPSSPAPEAARARAPDG